MSGFRPRSITLRGRVLAAGGVEEVFPLFSPAGERLWVPGWDPELLHPADSEWEEGQVFRTQEESGEAIWLTTRLDRTLHRAEYHRVEPGRYVARIEVRCRPVPPRGTEALIAYTFLGLSESGNEAIAAMTRQDYEAKMARWTEWIDRHLRGAGE